MNRFELYKAWKKEQNPYEILSVVDEIPEGKVLGRVVFKENGCERYEDLSMG